MAAPIFLFLCGVSFALVTERLRQNQAPAAQIFKTALLRGAQILGFGFLLRLQEFVLGYPKSPWTDLFRVDVLNILGISILLMAVFWRLTATPPSSESWTRHDVTHEVQNWRARAIALSLLIAAVIALVTPPLWTTYRPHFLPWMLESYIDGVHIYNVPQTWLFAIFPWCGFAFVGLAFGVFLFSDFAQRKEVQASRHPWRGWRSSLCFVSRVRLFAGETVRRVRLLAQQPEFLPDALRNPADTHVCHFCVVPLGNRHARIQSIYAVRQNLATGLLGAHRIRVRASLHFAKRAKQHPCGHRRDDRNFCRHAGAVSVAPASTRQKRLLVKQNGVSMWPTTFGSVKCRAR